MLLKYIVYYAALASALLLPALKPSVACAQTSKVLISPINPVDPKLEYRICGEPKRNADGSIKRSTAVINAYRRLYPCPATGLKTGACPGWAIDHIIPIASGGCDAVVNMAWMPEQIKSCSSDSCIDRWERTYYATPFGVIKGMPDTPSN